MELRQLLRYYVAKVRLCRVRLPFVSPTCKLGGFIQIRHKSPTIELQIIRASNTYGSEPPTPEATWYRYHSTDVCVYYGKSPNLCINPTLTSQPSRACFSAREPLAIGLPREQSRTEETKKTERLAVSQSQPRDPCAHLMHDMGSPALRIWSFDAQERARDP